MRFVVDGCMNNLGREVVYYCIVLVPLTCRESSVYDMVRGLPTSVHTCCMIPLVGKKHVNKSQQLYHAVRLVLNLPWYCLGLGSGERTTRELDHQSRPIQHPPRACELCSGT